MEVTVRPARAEDARAITKLSFQLGYQISEATTVININLIEKSEQDMAYVAILNYNVVGWIHVFYSLRIESAPFCEIGGLVVDEHVRGKGVGKRLIGETIEWSKNKSVESLRVRTNIIRQETHKFYERMGFILTKQQSVFGLALVNNPAEQ